VEDVILTAIEIAGLSSGSLAECLSCVSEVYIRCDKLDAAEASLKRAVELHQQAHSVLDEASDLQILYIQRDNPDNAEASSKRAVDRLIPFLVR